MKRDNTNEKKELLLKEYDLFIKDRNIKFNNCTKYKEYAYIIKENLLIFLEENNFNKEKFSMQIKKYNLNPDKTIQIIIRYVINQKSKREWDFDKIKKYFSPLTNKRIETIKDLFDKVLETNDEETLYNLIETSIHNYIYKGFGDYLYSYAYNLSKENHKEIYNKLHKKILLCKNIKSKKENQDLLNIINKQKLNDLNIANKIIDTFLNSNFTNIQNYCKEINIDLNTFEYYVDTVKEFNTELYNDYHHKILIIKQRNFISLLATGRTILDYLENGIIKQGKKQEFDLLDYYLLTKVEKNDIRVILNTYKTKRVYLFNRFIRKYKNSKILTDKNISDILNNKDYVGIEFDSNNKPIPNTGYEVTKDDKLAVFNYLKENNIPLLDDTYNIALKKYLNGSLSLNNQENLTKNR